MARTLTREESAERLALIKTWRAQKHSWARIGAALGLSEASAHTWFRAATSGVKKSAVMPMLEAARTAPKMTRTCNRAECGKQFESMKAEGAWLRSCPDCRTRAGSISPYAPDPGGSDGRRVQAMRRRGGA